MGQQGAVILRLEVIVVGAVAVNDCGDAVACAMDEILAIASSGDHGSHGIIDLSAFDALARCESLAYERDTGIARLAHDGEDFPLALGDFVTSTGEGHPGIVCDDRAGRGQFSPEVEQDKITAPDGSMDAVR